MNLMSLLIFASLAYNSQSLKTDYMSYNEQYFMGQLPPADIQFANLNKEVGRFWHDSAGIHIRIDRTTNLAQRQAEMTLLHESCHVWDYHFHPKAYDDLNHDDHGTEFQACMLRLAEQGAFSELW